jgi:hypothetical protein
MNLRVRGFEVNYRSLVQSRKKSGSDFREQWRLLKTFLSTDSAMWSWVCLTDSNWEEKFADVEQDNFHRRYTGNAEKQFLVLSSRFAVGFEEGRVGDPALYERSYLANAGSRWDWKAFRRLLTSSQFTTFHQAARYSGRRLLYLR